MAEESKLCEECGKKIPKARLKAIPNTEYCVECAAKVQGDQKDYIPDGLDVADIMDILSDDSDGY